MSDEKKEFWAIVSLMGRSELAGYLTEYTMGGCSFLRLQIPETSSQPAFEKLFKDNSIYSIDPVDEKTARWKAEQLKNAPITAWDASRMFHKQMEDRGQVLVEVKDLPDGFFDKQLPETCKVDTRTYLDDETDGIDENPF